MSAAEKLEQGLGNLGLQLSPAARQSLIDFVSLLLKWNKTYNLTAIRTEDEAISHHLLDSLALLPVLPESALQGRRWADVGSGAGLPGIPLAIARPDMDMTLIETVEKKSAFQRQAKIELGLANVEVVCARVESLPGGQYDAIVARAFAELVEIIQLAGHLLRPCGRLYAMKGVLAREGAPALPEGWTLAECVRLRVPGLDAERHLIVVEKG